MRPLGCIDSAGLTLLYCHPPETVRSSVRIVQRSAQACAHENLALEGVCRAALVTARLVWLLRWLIFMLAAC